MRPHGTPQELEARRLRAVELLKQGIEPHVVADRVGVDRRSVRRWNRIYRRRGRAGLKARQAAGRPSKLSARQRGTLARWILKGAEAFGFPTALWTCRRVAQLVRMRFGVSYHPDHVGRLLRACGLTPQRPQTVAKERNDQRIRAWVRQEWTRAKKNSPASGRVSSAWTKPAS
jgi:transposase